ncbi:MAG TPA: hypothetical protein VNT55_19505 [Baekduia sp.]|nr:hypothetical protein [Baekduia sp.]
MRRTAALAVSLAGLVGLGACAKESPTMPSICIDTGREGYERALAAAPGDVRLAGDVPISTCTRRVRTDAELQNLGTIVHGVAEDLAVRARAGDAGAAVRLGYLVAAVGAGADRSNGIAAELSRRVENTVVGVSEDAALARALRRGAAAGRARG